MSFYCVLVYMSHISSPLSLVRMALQNINPVATKWEKCPFMPLIDRALILLFIAIFFLQALMMICGQQREWTFCRLFFDCLYIVQLSPFSAGHV